MGPHCLHYIMKVVHCVSPGSALWFLEDFKRWDLLNNKSLIKAGYEYIDVSTTCTPPCMTECDHNIHRYEIPAREHSDSWWNHGSQDNTRWLKFVQNPEQEKNKMKIFCSWNTDQRLKLVSRVFHRVSPKHWWPNPLSDSKHYRITPPHSARAV